MIRDMKRVVASGALALCTGVLLLALWHGGLSWATDLGIRRFEAHATAHPPRPDPGEIWRTMRFFRDPDAYTWLVLTRDLRESGQVRIRRTAVDNAPYGREVHWAQLPIWLLAALSFAFERLGDLPPATALELAGLTLMPMLGFTFFSAILLFLARQVGVLAALLTVLPMAVSCHYEFHTLRPDHHGFQIAFATGSLLCLLGSGLGLTQTTRNALPLQRIPSAASARRWFIASGLFGGLALWMGATVFAFVLCAIAAGLALAWGRADTRNLPEEISIEPDLFRWWGLAGAASALMLYLVEYVPAPPAMRLEVNHPLYAACFGGTAECLRALARWKSGRPWRPRADGLPAAAGLLAALTLPGLVLFGPPSWYWPRLPLMLRLHSRHITEFLSPIHPAVSAIYLARVPLLLAGGLALGLTLFLLHRKCLPLSCRARLRLLATVSGLMFLLFCWQGRWVQFLPPVFFLLAGYGLAAGRAGVKAAALPPKTTWLLALLGVALLLQAGHAGFLYSRPICRMLRVESMDVLLNRQMLQRNLLLSLKAETKGVPLRLLLPAEMAPAAGYFGVGDTISSLYWENQAGLTAAAEFLADPLPGSRARAIARERSITHVLSYRTAGEARLARNLLTGRDDPAGLTNTLGYALAQAPATLPDWLREDYRLLPVVAQSYSVFLPARARWVSDKIPARIYRLSP